MTWKQLRSSNLHAYQHEGETLRIHFKSGAVYEYSGVSAEEAAGLENESAGKHFAAVIRGRKPHTRLDDLEVPEPTQLDGETPTYDTGSGQT
jgi:hypothetical protein